MIGLIGAPVLLHAAFILRHPRLRLLTNPGHKALKSSDLRHLSPENNHAKSEDGSDRQHDYVDAYYIRERTK